MGRGSRNSMLCKDPCPMRSELYPYDFDYPNGSSPNVVPMEASNMYLWGATYNSVHSSLLL